MKRLNDNMTGLSEEISRLDDITKKQTNQIESNKETVNGLTNKASSQTTDIERFKKNLNDISTSLNSAKIEINDLEQYGRRMMVKFLVSLKQKKKIQTT